jgi:hypothetical protein
MNNFNDHREGATHFHGQNWHVTGRLGAYHAEHDGATIEAETLEMLRIKISLLKPQQKDSDS